MSEVLKHQVSSPVIRTWFLPSEGQHYYMSWTSPKGKMPESGEWGMGVDAIFEIVVGTRGVTGVSGDSVTASNIHFTDNHDTEKGGKDAIKGIPSYGIDILETIQNALHLIHDQAFSAKHFCPPYFGFLLNSTEQKRDFEASQTAGIHEPVFQLLQPLIMREVSKPHEAVTRHLSHRLRRKATLMGDVDEELSSTGATTYQPTRTMYNSSGKEADDGVTPHRRRPGPQGWPTLIFESGVSETLERLHLDAKWWLTQSNWEVRAVLLAHIQVAEQVIDLEVWRKHKVEHDRPDTRSLIEYEPKCDENGQLRIDCSTVPATTIGTLPLLVITFEDLVLRGRNPGEGDFALDLRDIQSIATVFGTSI